MVQTFLKLPENYSGAPQFDEQNCDKEFDEVP
jgi:hypothetical protein